MQGSLKPEQEMKTKHKPLVRPRERRFNCQRPHVRCVMKSALFTLTTTTTPTRIATTTMADDIANAATARRRLLQLLQLRRRLPHTSTATTTNITAARTARSSTRRSSEHGVSTCHRQKPSTPWCLAGNGGVDPYTSPYIIPNNSPHNPFPHSLLSTRKYSTLIDPL